MASCLWQRGTVSLHISPRTAGMFEAFYNSVKPHVMFSAETELAPAGKLPDGEVQLPFAFDLKPLKSGQPLIETYQGVFVNSTYTVTATISRALGKKASASAVMNVISPGQGMPSLEELSADQGIAFCMSGGQFKGDGKS